MKLRTLLLSVALGSSCATSSATDDQKPTAPATAPTEPAEVEAIHTVVYYAGTVTATSPDGATPFGAAKPALVKREVIEAERRIIETTLDEGKLRVTTLTLADGNVFNATDVEGSFTGTLTFSPGPWNAESWIYDLTMADGSGKIEGSATISGGALRTQKYFVAADGERKVRIVDALEVTTEAEFLAASRAAAP